MAEFKLRNETLHAIHLQDADPISSDVTVETLPRARVDAQLHMGNAVMRDTIVPIDFIVYGEPERLEPPTQGVYRIVSQLTFLAAFRSHRPVHDLVVPYGYDPKRQAVKGLAHPTPIPNAQATLSIEQLLEFDHIDSACPFPIKIFPAATPEFVDPDECKPAVCIRSLDVPQMSVTYEREEIHGELSEKLGLPVFQIAEPKVRYNPEHFDDETVTIVEHRMFTAGFSMYGKNSVHASLLHQNVRAANGPYAGSVVGGTSLLVPLQLPYRI